MIKNLLPVLKMEPKWTLMCYDDNGNWVYRIPGWLIIRRVWLKNRKCWMEPGVDILVDPRQISWYMYLQRPNESIEYDDFNGSQYWFDRCILGITVPSDRPKCANCGKSLPFNRISKGGYGSMYGQKHQFCDYKCRDEYSHKHRLNGFEYINDHLDEFPDMESWYSEGGGLGYIQKHFEEYGIAPNPGYGHGGTFDSIKMNKMFYFRSTLEKYAFEALELDDDVIGFDYEPIKIPYEYDGIIHSYFPDFMASYQNGDTKVIELKPQRYINEEINLIKFEAARNYCKQKGWQFEVWTEYDF
jgi:hypothetical protein